MSKYPWKISAFFKDEPLTGLFSVSARARSEAVKVSALINSGNLWQCQLQNTKPLVKRNIVGSRRKFHQLKILSTIIIIFPMNVARFANFGTRFVIFSQKNVKLPQNRASCSLSTFCSVVNSPKLIVRTGQEHANEHLHFSVFTRKHLGTQPRIQYGSANCLHFWWLIL